MIKEYLGECVSLLSSISEAMEMCSSWELLFAGWIYGMCFSFAFSVSLIFVWNGIIRKTIQKSIREAFENKNENGSSDDK